MIQLPNLCDTRDLVSETFSSTRLELSPIVSFANVKNVTQDFADEMCRIFMARRIDRVTFLCPPESFLQSFMKSHMDRRAKFMVACRS